MTAVPNQRWRCSPATRDTHDLHGYGIIPEGALSERVKVIKAVSYPALSAMQRAEVLVFFGSAGRFPGTARMSRRRCAVLKPAGAAFTALKNFSFVADSSVIIFSFAAAFQTFCLAPCFAWRAFDPFDRVGGHVRKNITPVI
jgi:hypothetical protein